MNARGRRVAIAALVAVGLAGLGVAAGVSRASDPEVEQAARTTQAVTWARGSVIHDGSRSIDVGRTVYRFVQTRVGFVFTDSLGRVWSAHDGSVDRVGTTYGPLVSDPDGTLAGWVDSTGRRLSYVFLDQGTGALATEPGHGSRAAVAPGEYLDGSVTALDGRVAIWQDKGVYESADLSSSAGRIPHVLPPLPNDQTAVLASRGGVLVEADWNSDEIRVIDPGGQTVLKDVTGNNALIAPEGRWVAFGTDEGQIHADVYDVGSGRRTRLDPDAWSALVTQWLDPETIAVLSARTEHSHYQLLACDVRAERCSVVVADLGEAPDTGPGNGLGFRLPIGDYYFPYPHG